VKGFREAATDARAASGDENSVAGQLHKLLLRGGMGFEGRELSGPVEVAHRNETVRKTNLGTASSMPWLPSRK
jgi:hypothetical protein